MSDLNLFPSEKNSAPFNLSLPNAEIIYFSDFYSSEEATTLFKMLLKDTDWQQDNIKVFGKIYKQPRLTALYGDDGASYSYSGITMFPKPFNAALKRVKSKIEEVSEVKFNTVLLNLYRDGNDSNGWHSDDEKELGENPVIASLSLGADRVFQLRNKTNKKLRENLLLKNGSLLLMAGSTQHHWQHCIPKSKKITNPRINLTFRILK